MLKRNETQIIEIMSFQKANFLLIVSKTIKDIEKIIATYDRSCQTLWICFDAYSL